MKKHNIVKVVLVTILVLLLCTWIFPAAYYSSEVVDQGRVQMGLSEMFNYPMTVLSYFGYISLFIILVGGFYGILYKIPAYRTYLDKFVSKFEGKEKLLLSIISIIIALGVSIANAQLALILFIPLFVSLILLMGYDKIVAALVVVGSISVGFIGTTYSSNNISSLLSSLSLNNDYQIGVRFVILLVGIVLLLFNTFMYIKSNGKKKMVLSTKLAKEEHVEKIVEVNETVSTPSTKKSSSISNNKKTSTKSKSEKGKSTKSSKSKTSKNVHKAALRDEDIIVIKESVVDENDSTDYLIPSRVESSHKTWPFVTFLGLLFILMVLAFISWGDGGFGIKFFNDLTTGFQEFKLFGFPIFAKVYGSIVSFGSWTIIDLLLPMALVILLLAIIYKVKLNDIFDGFASGAKKSLSVAFVSILVYVILVVVTYHPFQLVLYKAILGLTKDFNIATTVLTTFLTAFFNVDSMYAFQALLPYYTSVVIDAEVYPLVGIISQSMYGLYVLFAPTSLILMCALEYLKVPYKVWLKNSWKFVLELFVVLLIIFIILALL